VKGWSATNPNMPADYRASRDLVGDLTAAVRAEGLRMGLYYAGGVDWTFTEQPIRTPADMLSGQGLVHLFTDVVSKGGSLLINVGPDGLGHIPDMQQAPLSELGEWLDSNGEAIFGTRPWSQTGTTTTEGHPVRFTVKDGTVYLIVLTHRLSDAIVVRNLTASPDSRFRLLGDSRDLAWSQVQNDARISLPPQPIRHAHVLAMQDHNRLGRG
jgi:alpha-L-fucosidase